MAVPENVTYGQIIGRFTAIVADGSDPDALPDGIPLQKLNVTISSSVSPPMLYDVLADPPQQISLDAFKATTNADGDLALSATGPAGIWVPASDNPNMGVTYPWTYTVTVSGSPLRNSYSYTFILPTGGTVDLATVTQVTAQPSEIITQWQAAVDQTEANVAEAQAIVGALDLSQYVKTINGVAPDVDGNVVVAGGGGGGGGVTTVNGDTGAVTIDVSNIPGATAVGRQLMAAVNQAAGRAAIGAGTSSVVVGTASGQAADAQVVTDALALKVPTSRKVAGHDLTGDVPLVKGDVGLSNVDNTSDASKPVSTAQASAIAAKADASALASHTSDTANPHAVTKTQVGLGNVDNTSDAAKSISTATATALAEKLRWRGDYVEGGTYAVNDVVNSPGYGSYKCLQAHTSSGSAPNIESPFWHLLGSAVVIGTNTGQAADGGATSAALGAKLDSGYAGAVPGTVFTVLWVAGTGWPARPTTRTDVFVDWVDVTGESTDTDTPTDIVTGDRIVQIVTGTGGTSAITVRSVTSAAGTAAADYQNSPLPLAGPVGIAIGDYYLVAACFGSLPPGSDFIAPAGFTRLTPAIATGQDFAVFGRPIGTSADVSAVASTNWSPNTHTSTRAVVVGVALQGVASVGTATAVTFANPITSPYTLDAATGDATFQVVYTGNGSTSTHPVHASVGGTLLVQAVAKTAAADPTSDNVLSISMNGTGVSWSPAAAYGGATNIPMTKA